VPESPTLHNDPAVQEGKMCKKRRHYRSLWQMQLISSLQTYNSSAASHQDSTCPFGFIDISIAWGNDCARVKSGYQLPIRECHHIVVSMDNIRHEAQFYIYKKIEVK
jgi:hypothetical protein